MSCVFGRDGGKGERGKDDAAPACGGRGDPAVPVGVKPASEATGFECSAVEDC